METNELTRVLTKRVADIRSPELLEGLSDRKRKELEFHNRDRDTKVLESLPQDTYELLHGNKKYYSTVALSREYVDGWLKENVPGKVFLDYACGNGGVAIKAVKLGAKLSIGLDLSDVSIENAQNDAKREKVSRKCFFVQGDCESTGLPSESVDVIICSGMLHHLELSFAFPELRRILRPGGKILCIEALDYNPLIKMYRNLTPSMRTDWEKKHILSLKDIRFAERFFDIGEVRYWHLFSIAGAFLSQHELLFKRAMPLLNALDSVVMRLPWLQRMGWQFTFELNKRDIDGAHSPCGSYKM
jgi:ubiquinone/menaquinone biosynthesis C-methylase UbiE